VIILIHPPPSQYYFQHTLGLLPKAQQLQIVWKQTTEERAEVIKQLNKLSWETYWKYLVKPHSQWMTLKCLITSVKKIVPALAKAVFAG